MVNIVINEQMILMVVIAVSLLIVCFIIYTFIKDKKQDQEEINDIMNDIIDSKPKEITEVTFKDSIEISTKKSELEEMLEKMQKDLEAKSEDVVEIFEKEQEEKSIISYNELVKTKEKLVEEFKPISIVQLEDDNFEKPKQKEVVKKFKSTEFISPIYGKMNEKLVYPTVPAFNRVKDEKDVIEEYETQLESHNIDDYLEEYNNNIEIDNLEQTLNMAPISADVKKDEDFLQALKDFRKNLE